METKTMPVVTLTDGAVDKVKTIQASNPEFTGKAMRVFVQGGGCAGFSYGFSFDDAKPTDEKVSLGGVSVLIDPEAAEVLGGSTIDYVEDLQGSGFSIQNPNVKKTCGCGTSFSV